MTHPNEFMERIRRDDSRVAVIERGLLAAQLGTTIHDLDLLDDAVVNALLNRSNSPTTVIGALRLLELLDAHVARAHPVDVEHGQVTTATVPIGEDDAVRLALENGVIHLPHRDLIDITLGIDTEPGPQVRLSPTDAEFLAYALLRLVQIHRSTELLKETDR